MGVKTSITVEKDLLEAVDADWHEQQSFRVHRGSSTGVDSSTDTSDGNARDLEIINESADILKRWTFLNTR
jgi:hypothetical protein